MDVGSSLNHIPPNPPMAGETVSFEVTIPIYIELMEAIFFYKMNNQKSYNEIEMEFLGNTWTATISNVPEGEKIEYFFIFRQQDRSKVSFQWQHTHLNPYLLSVTPKPNYKSKQKNSETFITSEEDQNFLIISPDENDIVYTDGVLIMVSLFNTPEVDINSIQIYLNDQDVTTEALITPEIITYAPQYVDPGIKTLSITAFTHNGNTIPTLRHTISILNKAKETSLFNSFKYSVKGNSEVLTDRAGSEKLNVGLTDLTFKGGWPRLQFQSRFKITTDENPFKQPKNRYSATIKSGRLFKIKFGDFTPSISPYTIKGKRMRGMGIDLRLGWFRFQLLDGELERAIQGLNDSDQAYKISNVRINTTGVTEYELDRRGYTFRNDINSYRLALNIKDKIIFGSTLMKVKNDYKSVQKELLDASFTVLPDTSFSTATQLDSGTYTFTEFQGIMAGNNNYNYQLAEKSWGGNKPQENLVIGTDFKLLLNRQKFLLEGYYALSLVNKDIWDGALSLAELDTVMGDAKDGKIFGSVDTLGLPNPKSIEEYITINLNLIPLVPIDFILFKKDPTKAVMNMPSSVYNLKLRTLYFNNFFEIQYLQVGPEFTSLANPYFPKNIREISFVDKIWFFDRRLQTAVNYKTKTNDILETNSNPYYENTVGINLNYIPGIKQPSVMYGHQRIIRTNPRASIDTLTTMIDSISSLTVWDTTYLIQDSRVDFNTTNNLLTLNFPINRKEASYWVGGTFNSIVGTDQFENERPSGFLSQASTMRLLSIVLGARYKKGKKLIINISNFTNDHKEQGKTQLNGASITSGRPLLNDKINLTGTLSYLTSSGLSEFSNYGLSLGSKIIISKAFSINLVAYTRARSTSAETKISNFAVKLSTSFIF